MIGSLLTPRRTKRPYKDRTTSPRPFSEAFERQRAVDPFGERVHAFAACAGIAMVAAPTSVAEFAVVPPGLAWLIRMHRHGEVSLQLVRSPAFLALLAWLAWRLFTLAWSPDRAQGLDEMGVARFGLLAVFCWPAMRFRRWFLPALAFGFAVGQSVQATHALGLALDLPTLVWPRAPGRVSGWWDPVVAGSLLIGVLGLHLGAAFWGRGLWRVLGSVGATATAAGIVATGTRGAWLASAALIGIAVIARAVTAWRAPPTAQPTPPRAHAPRTHRARLIAAGALLAVSVVSVGLFASQSDALRARAAAGFEEVSAAFLARDYSTDTGARVGMALAALDAAREHPLRGLGAGGYRRWTIEAWTPREGHASLEAHAHAHNALLHELATTGAVGVLLALAFAATLLAGAARPAPGDGPTGLYRPGVLLAMVGMGLVSAFDAVHLNAQTAQLLAALGLCAMWPRPGSAAA